MSLLLDGCLSIEYKYVVQLGSERVVPNDSDQHGWA